MQKIKVPPVVESELFDDEKLYWYGKPNPRRNIRADEWLMLPAGIFAALFALFFIATATSMFDDDFPPATFQLPFLLVPLLMMGIGLWQAGAPLKSYLRGQQTHYVVTDRRILIIVDGVARDVESFYAKNVEFVRRRSHADGTGDVFFAEKQITRHTNNKTRTQTLDVGFRGIPQAKYVEDMLFQIFFENEDGGKDKNDKDKNNSEDFA
jgi:uncharacterized integral membrane protein